MRLIEANLTSILKIMRITLPVLGAVAVAALLASGCAGPEKKLGRGMNNLGEVARWGEMRRSMEQAGIWEGRSAAYGRGQVSGFNRSLLRIGSGIYEVATFPLPSYDPVLTKYQTVDPNYPDAYKPGLPDNTMFDADVALGFSGGEVAPLVPGSRFTVFRTP
jgi:putative exosortase-associated protein (TIGR04073 family)